MAELLEELVAAPTLLGDEAAGQAIMRRAFVGLGLEPFDVPLDRAALDGQPGAAPFSWDVAGKSNVLANWEPAAPADGRSLVLNGHIDVVSPEPCAACSGWGWSRARVSSCNRWSRRSAPATARSRACSPATRPTPRS